MKKKLLIIISSIIIIIVAILLLIFNLRKEDYYKVIFEVDGKKYETYEKIKKGKTIEEPDVPEKEGYTFDGWYLNDKKFNFDKPIKGDYKLEARWSINTYEINIDDKVNGVATITKGYGQTIDQPNYPWRYGYDFLGWYVGDELYDFSSIVTKNFTIEARWKESFARTYTVNYYLMNLNGKYDSEPSKTEKLSSNLGDKITVSAKDFNGFKTPEEETVTIDNNTVVNYYYERNKYLVSVVGDEGIENVSDSNEYYFGEEIEVFATVKPGYEFLNWSNENTDSTFKYVVEANDIELSATTQLIEYSITYNLNGGTLTLDNPNSYNMLSTSFTLNNPTKEGYTFIGWSGDTLNNQISTQVVINPEAMKDLTFTANYEANEYKVSFNANGGNLSLTEKTVTHDAEYGELPTPEKEGYTFDGWYLDSEFNTTVKSNDKVSILSDVTLYAKYEANEYKVSFNANGGSVPLTEKTVTYDAEYGELPTPEKEGYTFDGWYTALENGTEVSSSNIFDKDTNQTLYAIWTANTDTKYTVQHFLMDINGNYNLEETEELRGTTDSKVTPKVNNYTGFKIPEEETVVINPNGSTTVKYYYERNTYDVSFIDESNINTVKYYYESSIEEPISPTKEGYTFDGWYLDSEYKNKVDFNTIIVLDNTELFAKWNINKYTISFNSIGGSLVDSIEENYNTSLRKPESPTKEGYTFDGWYLDLEYNNEFVFDTMPSHDTELFAKWNINNYQITYDLDGGTLLNSQSEYTIESDSIKLGEPTKEGYTFIGWTGSNGVLPQLDVIIEKGSVGNKNYKANWTKLLENLDIELDSSKITYDGTKKTPKVTIKDGEYTLKEDTDYTLKYNNNINAGVATVTITVNEDANTTYSGEYSKTFIIYPKELKLSDFTYSNLSKTYDGTTDIPDDFNIELCGIEGNDSVNISYQAIAYNSKNVDEANSIILSGIELDNTNYKLDSTEYAVPGATIKKITLSSSKIVFSGIEKEYDGTVNVPSDFNLSIIDGVLDNDIVNLSYENASYNSKNVGEASTISVTGIASDNTNYKLDSTEYTVPGAIISVKKVQPKDLTYTGISKVYNKKNNVSNEFNIVYDEIENIDVTYENAYYNDVNAGNENGIKVEGLSLNNSNYELISDEYVISDASITKKPLNVADFYTYYKIKSYDGTANAPRDFKFTVPASKRIREDKINVSYENASYNSKNVDEANSIIVTGITIDNSNYELDTTEYTVPDASIIPIDFSPDTLIFTGTEKTYDGDTNVSNSFSISAENQALNGDVINVSYESALYSDANAIKSNYIIVTGLSLDNTNYKLQRDKKNVTAKILPKLIDAPTCENKVYDGSRKTLLEATEYFTVSNNAVSVDAGTYDISVTATQNYIFENNEKQISLNCTIEPKELDINNLNYTNITKKYDGTTSANSSLKLTISEGTVNGEIVDVSYESALYNSENVSEANSIAITGISPNNTNYKLNSNTYVIEGASIEKATSTCKFYSFANITYPRTTNTSISYICTGDGEINVVSDNTDVIEVLNSNNSYTNITVKNTGTATLTLIQKDGDNYLGSSKTKQITVGESKYKLTFNPLGGVVSPTSMDVSYNVEYESLPIPTRKGYTFDGWYFDKAHSKEVTGNFKLSSNQVLYAKWSPNSCTIILHTYTDDILEPISHETGSTIHMPSVRNRGASLENWYYDEEYTKPFDYNCATNGEIDLYARWIYDVDDKVIDAVKSFTSDSVTVVKDGNNLNAYFKEEDSSLLDLGMGMLRFFNNFKSNEAYKSIVLSYNGRSVDYLNANDGSGSGTLTIMARFVGWVATGVWSGSAGADATANDIIGKTIDVEIFTADHILTLDGAPSEKYKINFLKE